MSFLERHNGFDEELLRPRCSTKNTDCVFEGVTALIKNIKQWLKAVLMNGLRIYRKLRINNSCRKEDKKELSFIDRCPTKDLVNQTMSSSFKKYKNIRDILDFNNSCRKEDKKDYNQLHQWLQNVLKLCVD
ncbi:hypothetical protein KUTeg_006539 [Tegillarca granosa]|uniref:Uncharacterized protein n=1 Tax=Tegillarca granosa TaxID=220873 RepID=A0ABQ9FF29_TEGGR|nr:hypothetical protein KUTeg_006539 [Tegillarca granosa]